MQRLKTTLLAWPVITIAAMLLSFLTKEVAAEFFDFTLESQKSVTLLKIIAGWNTMFLKFFMNAVVICPVIEEIVFRYVLWRLPSPKRFWIGAVPSSILFTAAHYIQMPWPDNSFVALFFFGMAMCWLYKTTDRLWCPVLLHILFNLTNLLLVITLPEEYVIS